MPSLRVLLSPRLLVSHVLVLAVVATMVALGNWQLRRLDEVRTINTRLETRLGDEPVPLAEVTLPDRPSVAELDAVEFTQVTVTGEYRPGEEVLQRGRSLGGRSGFDVLTPLAAEDGTTVLVRRGWVPFDLDTPPVQEALPPTGAVTVVGWLERPGRQPEGFGQQDPTTGELERVFHADTTRLDMQMSGDLRPVVLHLEDQQPATDGELPVPAPRPEFSATTHLSYAGQWFAFALIAAVVYALWLRKRLRPEDGPADDHQDVLAEAPTPGE